MRTMMGQRHDRYVLWPSRISRHTPRREFAITDRENMQNPKRSGWGGASLPVNKVMRSPDSGSDIGFGVQGVCMHSNETPFMHSGYLPRKGGVHRTTRLLAQVGSSMQQSSMSRYHHYWPPWLWAIDKTGRRVCGLFRSYSIMYVCTAHTHKHRMLSSPPFAIADGPGSRVFGLHDSGLCPVGICDSSDRVAWVGRHGSIDCPCGIEYVHAFDDDEEEEEEAEEEEE
ncbi:hypothetical protein QBC42DRAFT_274507, partial [Cladorrhinum samala]